MNCMYSTYSVHSLHFISIFAQIITEGRLITLMILRQCLFMLELQLAL